MRTIDSILRDAQDAFNKNNEKYGNASEKVGKILEILFPKGINLKKNIDHESYHLLTWIIGKLVRYSNENEKHFDSIFDACVYSAMLSSINLNNSKDKNDHEE